MEIRRLEKDDILSLRKLWSVCYLFEMDVEKVREQLEAAESIPYGYGCFDEDGNMLSGMLGNSYSMSFDGDRCPLVGIGGVVTHPSYRKNGAVKTILHTMLSEQRANGTVFSGLYPFKFAFYRKFGYEYCFARTCYRFPIELLEPFSCDSEVKMFERDEDALALKEIHDAFAARYNLGIFRSDKSTNEVLSRNPYAGNTYLYALSENGKYVAYARFSLKEDGKKVLKADDLAYLSPEHFRKLLGLFYRFESEFAEVEFSLPDDVPLFSLLGNEYVIRSWKDAEYMMRVLNCEKALSAMNRGDFGSFVIEVEDSFLPENSGVWRVSADKAIPSNEAPDVKMSIQAFSQMLVGSVSYESALYRPDVSVFRQNPALAAAFREKPLYVGIHY